MELHINVWLDSPTTMHASSENFEKENVMEAFSFFHLQDKRVYVGMFIKRCVSLGIYPVEQYDSV
jgi:hypothetical protein